MSLENFTRNDNPTLGVEVELALVDAGSMALRSAYREVADGVPDAAADRVKPEFLRCYVEVDTGVCRDTDHARRDLARTIRAVEAAATRAGVALYWGGTHPFSRWRDQEVSPDPRYFELLEEYQEVVRRPVTFGLHVHVGVATGDDAIRAMNRVADRLPLLLALSANSPFWQGRATGLHSHRIDVLEGIPTGGPPPTLQSWDEYREVVDSFLRSGFVKSTKELWWDIRPNPEFGTIEVRICDTPADLATAMAITALIQCLVAGPAESSARPGEARALAIRQNRWLASRYGLDARLADPETATPSSARDQARRLVDRLLPTAEALGCADDLARVADLATHPTGSQRQLALYATTGDLAEVARRMTDSSRLTPRRHAPSLFGPPSLQPASLDLAAARP